MHSEPIPFLLGEKPLIQHLRCIVEGCTNKEIIILTIPLYHLEAYKNELTRKFCYVYYNRCVVCNAFRLRYGVPNVADTIIGVDHFIYK